MHFFFALFIVLAIIAMIYLLVGGLGLSELLPKRVSSALTKISVTIIITAFPLAIYDMAGVEYFGKIAIALFAIGLFFILKDPIYDIAKRGYRKRFGVPASGNEWICKKCGEVNNKINKVCIKCGGINPAEEPPPGDVWICKRCDKKNYLKDKNCTTCGYPRDDAKYADTA